MIKGFQLAVLYLETIAIIPVIEHQETWLECGIITNCLFQGVLRQLHGRSLAFQNHQGIAVPAEDHGITAFVKAIDLDGVLHSEQTRRHVKIFHQHEKCLLPHFLFRSEGAIPLPQRIKDQRLIPLGCRLEPLEIRHAKPLFFVQLDAVKEGLKLQQVVALVVVGVIYIALQGHQITRLVVGERI